MQPFSILLSVAGFFPHSFGGGQTYVYTLARELLKRGHHVRVLTSIPWNACAQTYAIERYKYDAIPVIGVAVDPDLVADVDKSSELGAITSRALREVLQDIRPDLLHLNGMKPPLIRLANELHIPYVLTAHHAGVACPNALLLRPDLNLCEVPSGYRPCLRCCASWRAIEKGKPPIAGNILGRTPKAVGRLANVLCKSSEGPYALRLLRYPWKIANIIKADRVILDESERIIAPSLAMKALLVRNGASNDKIVHLPHAIEPLPKAPMGPVAGRPLRFGYVGNYGWAKGLYLVIEALGMLHGSRKVELHTFGGDLQTPADRRLAGALRRYRGPVRLVDHGVLPRDRLSEAYGLLDVLIAPSVLFETFGLVVLEAFSVGRPAIVSRCGGPEELVRDGVDGFVVERNSAVALATAMRRFIDAPGLVLEMTKNILPVKTTAEYVNELEQMYRRILGVA